MNYESAEELFQKSKSYRSELFLFMELMGYRYSTSEMMFVDDGSLATEWADKANDYKRDEG